MKAWYPLIPTPAAICPHSPCIMPHGICGTRPAWDRLECIPLVVCGVVPRGSAGQRSEPHRRLAGGTGASSALQREHPHDVRAELPHGQRLQLLAGQQRLGLSASVCRAHSSPWTPPHTWPFLLLPPLRPRLHCRPQFCDLVRLLNMQRQQVPCRTPCGPVCRWPRPPPSSPPAVQTRSVQRRVQVFIERKH